MGRQALSCTTPRATRPGRSRCSTPSPPTASPASAATPGNPLCDGPILKPELPWETNCIEAPSVIKRGDTLYLFYGGGYNNDPQQIGCATSKDGLHFQRLFREPLIPNGQPGDWNASETGHPGVFEDTDGRTYLFVQGNNDKGRTWFLSCLRNRLARTACPWCVWDSPKFPMKRPGPAAHQRGWHRLLRWLDLLAGRGPRGGGLHYSRQAGGLRDYRLRRQQCGRDLQSRTGLWYRAGLIDGQAGRSLELDTYSPTVEWNRRTMVANDLPAGPHTMTVEVTGKKNPKSTNTYIQIVDLESR